MPSESFAPTPADTQIIDDDVAGVIVIGRLIVSAQMTMDSVMNHLQHWFEPESASDQHALDEIRAGEALILGRGTYQELSKHWLSRDSEFAGLINPMPKYVVSRTIEEPLAWNAQLLGEDIADEVAALKRRLTGNLISYGCGELANYLARRGLIDEVRFWLHPVVWGNGIRPFQAGELPIRLRLIGATPCPSGLVKLSYQPLGAH